MFTVEIELAFYQTILQNCCLENTNFFLCTTGRLVSIHNFYISNLNQKPNEMEKYKGN